MTKPTKFHVCSVKTQISLGIHPVSAWASAQSDQSSLCAQWVAKDPSCLHVDSKDSNQTGQMFEDVQVSIFSFMNLLSLIMSNCQEPTKVTAIVIIVLPTSDR